MRSMTAGLLVALLVLGAGCAGVSVSGDRVELEAGETVVAETAAEQAGYELAETRTEELNETVSPADREVRVVVRNHVAVYEKRGQPDGVDAVAAGVVTMPDVSVFGRNANPLARMNETELVEEFAGGRAVDPEVRDRYAVETLGGETDVTVYAVRADGGDREAFVHFLRTSPAETDDVVVAYATYPAEADGTERENVERLLSSLEYTPPDD